MNKHTARLTLALIGVLWGAAAGAAGWNPQAPQGATAQLEAAQETIATFKANNTEFSAQASAVIATNGAAAKTSSYDSNGVGVFVHIKGGAMVDASVGGQQFKYQPGLGAASGPVIASFEVGPGQVVYVGNLNAPIQVNGATQCWVDLSVTNASPHVTESFAKQVPYVTVVPTTALMTIKESFIRFPCGRDG